jgi:WD40 repeat protein
MMTTRNNPWLIDVATGKLIDILKSEDPVSRRLHRTGILFSLDGRFLVAGSNDVYSSKLFVWNTATRRLEHTMNSGHQGIERFRFSPDGSKLIATSGNWDGNGVSILEFPEGRLLHKPRAMHDFYIRQVLFSPDGSLLVTTDWAQVHGWDAHTGERKFTLPPPESTMSLQMIGGTAFSRDGSMLATSSLDDKVRVWDLKALKPTHEFPGHGTTGGQHDLVFSQDGRQLTTVGDDRRVFIWDLESRMAIQEYRLQREGLNIPTSRDLHDESLTRSQRAWGEFIRTQLSPDGTLLAVFFNDATYIYSIADGRVLHSYDQKSSRILDGTISPDNALVLTREIPRNAGNSRQTLMRLAELKDGRELKAFLIAGNFRGTIAFSPDGSLFVVPTSPEGTSLSVYNTQTLAEVCKLDGLESDTVAAAISSDNRRLACGLRNNTLLVFDISNGARLSESGVHP